jgi:hypothetical protein
MASSSGGDHFDADIYAHPSARLQGCQQVTAATADLDYTMARRNDGLADALEKEMVSGGPTKPLILFIRESIVELGNPAVSREA